MNKQKIPVTILTGFLGSGKTTLLNRILSENHGKKIAVIENEFGEIGVDNELVIGADEEIFEMNNGCICCTVRGDLIRILTRLTKRKDKLDRIMVETTGMANPAPVAQTFWVDTDMQENFSLDAIITLVDAKHIHLHLSDSAECKEQIAFADIILLNKADLVNEEELKNVQKSIRNMNALCEIYPTINTNLELEKILDIQSFDLAKKIELNPQFAEEEFPFETIVKYKIKNRNYHLSLDKGPDPTLDLYITEDNTNLNHLKNQATVAFSDSPHSLNNKGKLLKNQLLRLNISNEKQFFEFSEQEGDFFFFTQHGPQEFNLQLMCGNEVIEPEEIIEIAHSHSHDNEVSSVGLESTRPLNPIKFEEWIGRLLQTQGQDIFRCKGILYLLNQKERIVFQGVHMLFDAKPERLWKPNETKRNQLIFIGKNLDRKNLTDSFNRCLAS